MALNKTTLKNDIVSIMTDMLTRENTSIEEFAAQFADAIDDYVKDADINYTSGLKAPNGVITGTFNGNLS